VDRYLARSRVVALRASHSGYGPNQLTSASGIHASYDDAGNLAELKVERPGATCPSGASGSMCAQWFVYDWDEVGQLAEARRWDFTSSVPDLGEGVLPTSVASWDLHYAYSGGARVVKSATDNVGVERTTLEVFPTLRFDRDQFLSDTGDYERASTTTHVYFGGGIADAFYGGLLPDFSSTRRIRMFLNIGDHLGSSTVAIDQKTSEVVVTCLAKTGPPDARKLTLRKHDGEQRCVRADSAMSRWFGSSARPTRARSATWRRSTASATRPFTSGAGGSERWASTMRSG
jgi:hypothetical protein